MLDKEKIKRQEEDNDGQSVFLYYDGMIGGVVAAILCRIVRMD